MVVEAGKDGVPCEQRQEFSPEQSSGRCDEYRYGLPSVRLGEEVQAVGQVPL